MEEKSLSITTRLDWLDYFKGILVFIMVLAHCIQFSGDETANIQKEISMYANLTTFSCFFFVSGITSGLLIQRKPWKDACKKTFTSFWRYLIAYYISAVAFVIFAEGNFLWPQSIWDILFLKRLISYSEFLLAFGVIQLLLLILLPLWQYVGKRYRLGIIVGFILLCFVGTLNPYRSNKNTMIGLLIGSERMYSFPVLSYGLYFLAGLWFHKYRELCRLKKVIILLVIVLFAIPGVLYIREHQSLPERFPPGLMFIFTSGPIVILYTFISRLLELLGHSVKGAYWILKPLKIMGGNTLLFLLVSNLILFALKNKFYYPRTFTFVIPLFSFILCFSLFVVKIGYNNKLLEKKKVDIG